MTGAAGPAAALAAAGAGRSLKPPAISLSPEVVLHDRCNLVALPIVGGLVLAGLLGAVDTLLVSRGGQLGKVGGCGCTWLELVFSLCAAASSAAAGTAHKQQVTTSILPYGQVTKAFILYIVADFFYILLEPKAVPSR